MGGFFRGGAAATDRGAQLGARQGLWSIFNWGLPTGQALQRAGLNTLTGVKNWAQQLMSPGRTAASQMAAPVTQNILDQANAQRLQAGAFGTGRTGGTAALNREAGTATTKSIDDITNQIMQAGRAQGANTLMGISASELATAMNNLGLSADAVNAIMANATSSRQLDQKTSIAGIASNLAQMIMGKLMGGTGGGVGGGSVPAIPGSVINDTLGLGDGTTGLPWTDPGSDYGQPPGSPPVDDVSSNITFYPGSTGDSSSLEAPP
jgi:hypothetical protein